MLPVQPQQKKAIWVDREHPVEELPERGAQREGISFIWSDICRTKSAMGGHGASC